MTDQSNERWNAALRRFAASSAPRPAEPEPPHICTDQCDHPVPSVTRGVQEGPLYKPDGFNEALRSTEGLWPRLLTKKGNDHRD